MTITAAIAIYFIIWWTCLFAVLPFGIRSQHETGMIATGSDPGAPEKPGIIWRVGVTTILACVAFGLFYYIYTFGVIKMDDIPFLPHHLLRT